MEQKDFTYYKFEDMYQENCFAIDVEIWAIHFFWHYIS